VLGRSGAPTIPALPSSTAAIGGLCALRRAARAVSLRRSSRFCGLVGDAPKAGVRRFYRTPLLRAHHHNEIPMIDFAIQPPIAHAPQIRHCRIPIGRLRYARIPTMSGPSHFASQAAR
jgi:hypothetical protein